MIRTLLFLFLGVLFFSNLGTLFGQDHIPSPRKQMLQGVLATDVQCKGELNLIIRHSGVGACVKFATYTKLIEREWGNSKEDYIDSLTKISSSGDNGYIVKDRLQIAIFSPPESFDQLIKERLTESDMIASFNPEILQRFEIPQTILLSHSIPTTQSAIELSLTKSFDSIGYDNEASNGALSTPSNELIEPDKFTNEVGTLVKNAGLNYVVAPTKNLLFQEYEGVDWTNVDVLVMQYQKAPTNQMFKELTDEVSNYVKTKSNTRIFVQINPNFTDLSTIEQRISSVQGKIDGVSILCFTHSGCDTKMLSDLLTTLGR